jgi:hypothetical protein
VHFIHESCMKMPKKFRLTRRVAKHGSQVIITIPAMLKEKIKPGTIVEVTLVVLEEAENDHK